MRTEEKLLAPQDALWSYLDALLREIPADSVETEVEEIQEWDPAALASAQPAVVETPVVAVAEPVAAKAAVEVAAAPIDVATPQQQVEQIDTARPEWAQAEFQALLFSVGDLSLAVPLVTLHSVLPWPEEGVVGMPNQPSWCYGLLRYREQNVRVVDTATMVIPPDRAELMPTEAPKHLLIVGNGRWALACHAIGNVIRLTPDNVRWRNQGGNRPWLAGTVLEHLCALVDTDAFANMLSNKHQMK